MFFFQFFLELLLKISFQLFVFLLQHGLRLLRLRLLRLLAQHLVVHLVQHVRVHAAVVRVRVPKRGRLRGHGCFLLVAKKNR